MTLIYWLLIWLGVSILFAVAWSLVMMRARRREREADKHYTAFAEWEREQDQREQIAFFHNRKHNKQTTNSRGRP
jgi:flagellar biosynthesis/type III secretory pathway M-ring protein FliF/YscJ